jgi:hypothetical protein
VLAVGQQVISPGQLGNFSSLLAARAVALLRPNLHQRLLERIVSTGASGSFLPPDHRSSNRGQRSAHQRTNDYQNWVEAFARNHNIPIEWAQKGVRKEDQVLPWLRQMRKKGAFGVYSIFKSMEQGPTFRISVPKYPTKDPNHLVNCINKSNNV